MTSKEIDGILAQARAMDIQREAFEHAKLGPAMKARRCRSLITEHPPHKWRGLNTRGWYYCDGTARK